MVTACSSPDPFSGTVLEARSDAPNFELIDQFGQQGSLSDHQGDVVLLTFLYTDCPDICPVVANHVRDTNDLLEDVADEVSIVVVSVDPERDTIEAARAYSERWRMEDKWSYLVGNEEELRPIWTAYFIDPTPVEHDAEGGDSDTDGAASAETEDLTGVDALYEGIELRYTVTHSAPVYLIDQEGALRVLFTLPMDPEDIAHDVRLLLAE